MYRHGTQMTLKGSVNFDLHETFKSQGKIAAETMEFHLEQQTVCWKERNLIQFSFVPNDTTRGSINTKVFMALQMNFV